MRRASTTRKRTATRPMSCGSTCRPARLWPSPSKPWGSLPRDGRRARSVASRSSRRATSAPAATGSCTDPMAGEIGESTVARLTRAEMEAAAIEGRQVAGRLDKSTALRLLREGELTVVGRLLTASNAAFFAIVTGRGPDPARTIVAGAGEDPATAVVASCVYKPTRGERPLYDSPAGTLACREVAAHAVSEASGWEIVPPTVMRDGPFGEGMVQLWVEVDESVDVAELVGLDLPTLRRIAVLDAVLNNADRKGGHLLPLPDGRILGIDNGLSFAVTPKLRTVLWRWRGQPLTDEERVVLPRLRHALAGELGEELGPLLAPEEVAATSRRIEALLSSGSLPRPDRDRPAVPWPPF